ncbi:MAG: holB [Acidimicrobiales bacterium]|nr:holB [Acidimicrobiales bacterium]
MNSSFDGVMGQPGVVAQLQAAVVAPVHAYLLLGTPGAGARAAAEGFAAALLCPNGGCGECRDCRLALAGEHPDVLFYTPQGASLLRADGEEIIRLALRSPVEGRRKVLVLADMHRVSVVAPMLLKTIEEPPESTIFVVLADHVPPELVTIASRCVRIDVPGLPSTVVRDLLVAEGCAPELAETAAGAAMGSLDRARLLASDPGLVGRREEWARVPRRLDGSGAAVAVVVEELLGLVQGAAAPLLARQEAEGAELEERVAVYGERGSGRKRLEDIHKREQRRHRAEELRFGLATLADRYRSAVTDGSAPVDAVIGAVQAIDRSAEALVRNPNETLLLQSLLLRLPALSAR